MPENPVPENTVLARAIDREALVVGGRDAITYLHSQLSNDIASLGFGGSTHSFVLEPTGKVVALVRVTRLDAERLLVDFDPGLTEEVTARLLRFRIRVDVTFEPVVPSCVAVRSDDPIDAPVVDSATMVALPAWWCDGRAWDVVSLDVAIDPARFGTLVDVETFEQRRIDVAWPMGGREIVAGETLPAATGVVALAVNFRKGCYPGQELVERMDSRGATAPRVLRRIGAPAGARPGDSLRVDGDDVVLTSVAGDVALAYVRRGAND